MSTSVKNTEKVAIEIEVTEGTYVAPSSSSSFVQTLKSGLEMKKSKELIERDVNTGTIGQVTPRTGQKSSSGAVPTELKAHSVEGTAPEIDKLLQSCLGTKRQNTTDITTKATGATGSVLPIEDADISKLNVGDIILVKESGAYHVSPIISKTTGVGAATITLLVPKASGSFSASVVIAKFTTYTVAESGHPTLSLTKYLDDAIKDVATGCRINKLELQNFSTGKIPTINFGYEGLSFDKTLEAAAHATSFDSALPPIVLDGRVYVDGASVEINELSLSIENTAGFKTSITSKNGKVSSRLVSRKISGSINPYQDTTDITNYTRFVENTEFSLFAYVKNDKTPHVDGEFQNIVAVYVPNCLITEVGEPDADGLVQEALSLAASRGPSGTSNEIYICFI